MAGDARNIDFGGNTLVVEALRVGATAPGQDGTAISGGEFTYLDAVTAGTGAASKAVVLDSSSNVTGLGVVGIARVDLDSATATLVSNATTLTKWSAKITTEALTTAAGASQAFVITKTGVAAGDLCTVTRAGGTNTRRAYNYDAVCTTNTVTVTVFNNEASNAINGTLIFDLIIFKA